MKAKKRLLPESRQEALEEARKYFENAKETLKKSPIEFGIYTEPKFVKEASAMGYLAALRAIDSYLLARGTKPERLPASIDEYRMSLRKIPHNGKLMAALTVAYQNLHIFAYYRGGVDVEMVKSGLTRAEELVENFSRLNMEE
jgi:hypothetical protein